jgi:hypothetical protein
MRSVFTKPRIFIFATAVLAVCTVAGVTASGSLASTPGAKAKPKSQACNVINNVTEETVGLYYIGTTPQRMTEPGDTAVYYDNIYDSVDSTSGAIIGHVVGYMTGLYKLANGDLMTQYSEDVQLADGTIRDSGIINRASMMQGDAVTFAAVGTSGEYLGQRGYREWQLVPPLSSELASVDIQLCG